MSLVIQQASTFPRPEGFGSLRCSTAGMDSGPTQARPSYAIAEGMFALRTGEGAPNNTGMACDVNNELEVVYSKWCHESASTVTLVIQSTSTRCTDIRTLSHQPNFASTTYGGASPPLDAATSTRNN